MNINELRSYCDKNGINPKVIDMYKEAGAKNANQIMKRIEESKKALRDINNLIEEAEYMRKAYFFTPPRVASMRRSYENKHSVDKFDWEDGKDTYSAAFYVSCSCNNVYAKGEYTKNGVSTNLKAIKSSYSRLHKLIYA